MKKLFLQFVIILIAFLIPANNIFAQGFNQSHTILDTEGAETGIVSIDSSYTLGLPSQRWEKIYTTDLDVSGVFSFGGSMSADLDMNDNDILNIGTADADTIQVGDDIQAIGGVFYSGGASITIGKSYTFDDTAYSATSNLFIQAIVDGGSEADTAFVAPLNNIAQSATANADDIGYLYAMSNTAEALGSGTISDIMSTNNYVGVNAGTATKARGALTTVMSNGGTINKLIGNDIVISNNGGTVPLEYGQIISEGFGTSTVANAVGIAIDNFTHATDQVGLLLGTQTKPSGSYSIYSASTDDSLFKGNVHIGDDVTVQGQITSGDYQFTNTGTATTSSQLLSQTQFIYDPVADGGAGVGANTVTQTNVGNTHTVSSLSGADSYIDHLGTGVISYGTGSNGIALATTGDITYATGFYGVANTVNGDIANGYGVWGQNWITGTGNIDKSYGLYADDALDYDSGVATYNIGLGVGVMASGTNNIDVLLGTYTPPTGDYAIYSANTDDSVFAGDIEATAFCLDTGECMGNSYYAEMDTTANTTQSTILAVDQWHGSAGNDVGILSGWTFEAGGSETIISFADYSGTVAGTIKATTSTDHGWATGDIVTLIGANIEAGDANNYHGVYEITIVDDDEFYFTNANWNATTTASAYKPDVLIAGAGADGTYLFGGTSSAYAPSNDKVYDFTLFINDTEIPKITARIGTKTSGVFSNASGAGMSAIVEGDKVWFGIKGITDDTNLTIYNAITTLYKL